MVQITKADKNRVHRNFLVYAHSGSGKTVFAASGRPGKILFLAPEADGIISPLELGYEFDQIICPTWEEFKAAYEYLYDNPDKLAQYDWVVIDSITKMQEVCFKYIIDSQRAERILRDQDPDQPQIQDYGKRNILVYNMVVAFNDLPVNVMYTALARLAEDTDGNEFLVPMIGSDKTKDFRQSMKIAAEMTSYGFLRVDEVEKPIPLKEGETEADQKFRKVKQRVITWEDNSTARGKDRTTRLLPKTILPSKNALIYVQNVANGIWDKDGKPIQLAPKKVAAKKVAPKPEPSAVTTDGNSKRIGPDKMPNPANTPDDAADISDSVPQHRTEDGEVDLDAVNA